MTWKGRCAKLNGLKGSSYACEISNSSEQISETSFLILVLFKLFRCGYRLFKSVYSVLSQNEVKQPSAMIFLSCERVLIHKSWWMKIWVSEAGATPRYLLCSSVEKCIMSSTAVLEACWASPLEQWWWSTPQPGRGRCWCSLETTGGLRRCSCGTELCNSHGEFNNQITHTTKYNTEANCLRPISLAALQIYTL